MMGCSAGDDQCDSDEEPRHRVTMARAFELGKYEVTQGQWTSVMGTNPSAFKGDERLPVERVSWNDVLRFIEVDPGSTIRGTCASPTASGTLQSCPTICSGSVYAGNIDTTGQESR
jgi:hypothetical protein